MAGSRLDGLERAALRELRRRIAAGAVTPGCCGEVVRYLLTEISWDLAREPGPRALVHLALENEELMLTTPTATQAWGEETPCAEDVLRWRLYEHLEAVLALFLRGSSAGSFIESSSG
jgi:hypothetical protein